MNYNKIITVKILERKLSMKKVIVILLLGFFTSGLGMQKQKSYLEYLPQELRKELNHFVVYNKIREALECSIKETLESSKTFSEALKKIEELARNENYKALFDNVDLVRFLLNELKRKAYARQYKPNWILKDLENRGVQSAQKLLELHPNALRLIEASGKGNIEKVRDILSKGISDIDTQEEMFGCTALYYAAQNGYREIVALLLEKGADANIGVKTKDNYSALKRAAVKGYKEIVEMLIQAGADINARDNIVGFTALMDAARNGHKEVVELLIKAGADVNAKDLYTSTVLMHATRGGHKDIVQMLLAKGAEVNVRNRFGETALMLATEKGHSDIVELLKKYGAKE